MPPLPKIDPRGMTVDTPEKKGAKVIMELLRRLPVVHVDSSIRFILIDLLLAHLPLSLLSWPPLKEVRKESATIKNSYLLRLDGVLASVNSIFPSGHFLRCSLPNVRMQEYIDIQDMGGDGFHRGPHPRLPSYSRISIFAEDCTSVFDC
eukprot:Gb_31038 [translate_table: standard]